tara:strand:+ start:8837 stop:9076 length:240 start_codon:yes stop_codon:yes gene_type:complete
MTKKLENTIINIVKKNLNTKKKITIKSGPYSIEEWDSIKHVEILAIISKKFRIKLKDSDYEILFDLESIINFLKINEKK